MKKEVTMVAKDKCPMDVLAELGERTKSAWIFLHKNVVRNLESSCDKQEELFHENIRLTWEKTSKNPETSITIQVAPWGKWDSVSRIEAEDIPFDYPDFSDPEEIFFLKMEE